MKATIINLQDYRPEYDCEKAIDYKKEYENILLCLHDILSNKGTLESQRTQIDNLVTKVDDRLYKFL